MYTLNEIKEGTGLFQNGLTKIYKVDQDFYTVQKNDYMKVGYVWGYGHFEDDTPVIEQI